MFLIPKDFWEVKNTKNTGKGVFAKKDINPGVVIGDYIGIVYKTAEENFYQDDKDLYLMYYSDEAFIYPDLKKEGVHLLNHSCTPNCWMYTYKGHTLFFTLRKIFKGEQLTISYLLSPLSVEGKQYICKCDGIICFQTMHLSEKRYFKWLKFHQKQSKETKISPIKFKKELPMLKSYLEDIPDNPIYSLFGSNQEPEEILGNTQLPSLKEIRELIRQTGKNLEFPNLKLKVYGILDNLIISSDA